MLRTPDLGEKTKKLSEESEVMQIDSTPPPEVPGVPEALGPRKSLHKRLKILRG